MWSYIVRRFLLVIPVMLGVSVLVFLILHLTPGDPAVVIAGSDAPAETLAQVREALGLNQPLHVQFGRWAWRALQGDLGRSLRSREPVSRAIGGTFRATLELAVAGILLACAVAVPLGVVSAVRRGTWVDNASRLVAFLGVSMPVFAVGLLLMWTLGFLLRWFPLSGRGGPVWTLDGLRHLVLPTVTVATFSIAVLTRLTRSSVLEVLQQDYIRTARAKGLSERVVVFKHALRNALLPVITVLGISFGALLGGAVVTETIFAWPGMGRMAIGAILTRDFPLVQGIVLLLSLIFVIANLVVDLLYAFVDPRIQYQ